MRRKSGVVFIIAVLSVAAIEICLRVLDPWGVHYFYDGPAIAAQTIADPAGFAFVPGRVQLRHWSFTIDDDGTRTVPGDTPGGTPVSFYGDSVTFGYGVNDDETWVSLVCAELRLDCTNHARSGFSAFNVAALIRTHPADCRVVFTIGNDVQRGHPLDTPWSTWPPMPLWLIRYIWFAREARQPTEPAVDYDLWRSAMNEITSHPDTLLLSFDDEYGRLIASEYGAVVIPSYTQYISVVDVHANAAGNRQIADAAGPVIREWLAGRECR
jgi:hypothetical protein